MDNVKRDKRYETIKVIVIGVFVFMCVICTAASITASVYKARFDKAQSELGQLRVQLESVANRERELRAQADRVGIITREAVEYVSRERDLLLTSGTTIKEIRAQINDLETYCNNLEWYIIAIMDNSGSNKDSNKE